MTSDSFIRNPFEAERERLSADALALIHPGPVSGFETCGLCGRPEPVNQLGEFVADCPRVRRK